MPELVHIIEADGTITTPSLDLTAVALGLVPGYSIVNKFGRNDDVDTGTLPESAWNGGGLYDGFNATVAETVDVASTDANDTAAGTGARTVIIDGLDSSWNPQTETITMNGTTAVTSVKSYIRCPRAYVATAGSGGENAGGISATQTTSGYTFFAMPAGTNQTHICCYTIPAGKTGHILHAISTLLRSGTTEGEVDIYIREPGGVFRSKFPMGVTQNGGQIEKNHIPFIRNIPEKSDIDFRIVSVSANSAAITAAIDIILEDN